MENGGVGGGSAGSRSVCAPSPPTAGDCPPISALDLSVVCAAAGVQWLKRVCTRDLSVVCAAAGVQWLKRTCLVADKIKNYDSLRSASPADFITLNRMLAAKERRVVKLRQKENASTKRTRGAPPALAWKDGDEITACAVLVGGGLSTVLPLYQVGEVCQLIWSRSKHDDKAPQPTSAARRSWARATWTILLGGQPPQGGGAMGVCYFDRDSPPCSNRDDEGLLKGYVDSTGAKVLMMHLMQQRRHGNFEKMGVDMGQAVLDFRVIPGTCQWGDGPDNSIHTQEGASAADVRSRVLQFTSERPTKRALLSSKAPPLTVEQIAAMISQDEDVLLGVQLPSFGLVHATQHVQLQRTQAGLCKGKGLICSRTVTSALAFFAAFVSPVSTCEH